MDQRTGGPTGRSGGAHAGGSGSRGQRPRRAEPARSTGGYSAGNEGITYADAVELIGVTDARVLNQVVESPGRYNDAASLFDVVDQVIEAGQEPRRFATDVLDRLRDLIVLQAMPDAAERGRHRGAGGSLADLQSQVGMLGPAELTGRPS